MASIGAGYDLSATTYSPDGRLFQVEYASKAVESSGTIIGVKTKDSVILACEKPITSKLLKPHSNRRIHSVELHAGVAGAGLTADCRALAQRARAECASYREVFEGAIPGPQLAERLALYCQTYTLYASVRPFCASLLVGVVDEVGPHLYLVEPSGVAWGYGAIATGKGKQAARTELEKHNWLEMDTNTAVKEVAKIIYLAHDSNKDKEFELEMSWIGPISHNQHQLVPLEVLETSIREAKDHLASRMEFD